MCGCDNWALPITGLKVIPAQSLNLHFRTTEKFVRCGARDVLVLTFTSNSHFCSLPFLLWINISIISDLFSESMCYEVFSGTRGQWHHFYGYETVNERFPSTLDVPQ